MPETPQDIPLSRAYLCADCAAVGNNSQVCPACASKVLQSLAGVLDRRTYNQPSTPTHV